MPSLVPKNLHRKAGWSKYQIHYRPGSEHRCLVHKAKDLSKLQSMTLVNHSSDLRITRFVRHEVFKRYQAVMPKLKRQTTSFFESVLLCIGKDTESSRDLYSIDCRQEERRFRLRRRTTSNLDLLLAGLKWS